MTERTKHYDKNKRAKELAIAVFETIEKSFPNFKKKLVLEHKQVDLMLDFPLQENLIFPVSVNLQGDELHLNAGERLWVEWTNCDEQEVADNFQQTVIGLLKGTNRIVEYYLCRFYMRAELQQPVDQSWKVIATNYSWCGTVLFTPRWLPARREILQNSQDISKMN